MDFIGEIADKSSGRHKWILVAIDYFTKWIEAILTKNDTSKVVTNFLMENILTRFGVPFRLVVDNESVLGPRSLRAFAILMELIFYLAPYHPQRNGQAESSNKCLMKIIKRMMEKKKMA